MTIRNAMMHSLRAALADVAGRDGLLAFLRSRQNPDGGFCGAVACSDVYYSLFAAELLLAAGETAFQKGLIAYLSARTPPFDDLISLTAAARLHAAFQPDAAAADADRWQADLARFRCDDGGVAVQPGGDATLYGTFLALGMCQDIAGGEIDRDRLNGFVRSHLLADGSAINHPRIPLGSVPVTAAAVMILHQLGDRPPAASTDWLRRQFQSDGGCKATPLSPATDLLSTAVALFALRQTGADFGDRDGDSAAYIRSLRQPGGGFFSDAARTQIDVEYTYYGLLGSGSLHP